MPRKSSTQLSSLFAFAVVEQRRPTVRALRCLRLQGSVVEKDAAQRCVLRRPPGRRLPAKALERPAVGLSLLLRGVVLCIVVYMPLDDGARLLEQGSVAFLQEVTLIRLVDPPL
eukprot:12421081-Karenia_brevis.AAC.1